MSEGAASAEPTLENAVQRLLKINEVARTISAKTHDLSMRLAAAQAPQPTSITGLAGIKNVNTEQALSSQLIPAFHELFYQLEQTQAQTEQNIYDIQRKFGER